jgi:hypothetical protein
VRAIRDGGDNGSIIGRNTKAKTDFGCHLRAQRSNPDGHSAAGSRLLRRSAPRNDVKGLM